MEGIFITHGPGIKANGSFSRPRIVDLAPTILHILGLPVPDDMDGAVLRSVFLNTVEPIHAPSVDASGAVRSQELHSTEDAQEVGERLRALG